MLQQMSSPQPPHAVPGDNHVHSEWSWDAGAGAMEASCSQAIELGLPSIAFTEHWDPTPCPIEPAAVSHLPPLIRRLVSPDDVFRAPPLNVEGFVEHIEQCRERFPQLRILSGVELGEPHWWPNELAQLVGSTSLDRILGSIHCVEVDGRYTYIDGLFGRLAPQDVIGSYLAEVLRLVESSTAFEVLAHIDYPVRYWHRSEAAAYEADMFEDEYRTVLRALARSGRALEINTAVPLSGEVLRWWHEAGGKGVSFGSDAHQPVDVARGFARAHEEASALGFIDLADGPWPRT